MERQFEKGDIVILKSGGPNMTVEGYAWHGNYESNDVVICYWFDGSQRNEGTFNQETLKISE